MPLFREHENFSTCFVAFATSSVQFRSACPLPTASCALVEHTRATRRKNAAKKSCPISSCVWKDRTAFCLECLPLRPQHKNNQIHCIYRRPIAHDLCVLMPRHHDLRHSFRIWILYVCEGMKLLPTCWQLLCYISVVVHSITKGGEVKAQSKPLKTRWRRNSPLTPTLFLSPLEISLLFRVHTKVTFLSFPPSGFHSNACD